MGGGGGVSYVCLTAISDYPRYLHQGFRLGHRHHLHSRRIHLLNRQKRHRPCLLYILHRHRFPQYLLVVVGGAVVVGGVVGGGVVGGGVVGEVL